jgi:hypothetical protein
MPAIASNNAIAAALEIREAVEVISNRLLRVRVIHFTSKGKELLFPCNRRLLTSCKYCAEQQVELESDLDSQYLNSEAFMLKGTNFKIFDLEDKDDRAIDGNFGHLKDPSP